VLLGALFVPNVLGNVMLGSWYGSLLEVQEAMIIAIEAMSAILVVTRGFRINKRI